MKNMKKFVSLFLVIALVFMGTMSASAAENDSKTAGTVGVRYTYLYMISAGLDIVGGTAECDSYACTSSSGYTISLTMTLYRNSSVAASWVDGGPGFEGVSLDETVPSLATGYTYQVKAVARVYSGGVLVETATRYSQSISY